MDNQDFISSKFIQLEIDRLQSANAMMRSANRALAQGNDAVLMAMGYSQEHICDLHNKGGIPLTSITNNTRMIAYLRSVLRDQEGAFEVSDNRFLIRNCGKFCTSNSE
ncbi:hypothetical protein EO087_04180 [Dyella sp. M7H15-1]|uniref:hypothetical protein n=1 Tax=Dyella sp. M7H15-1 TaxID=2501295 RepID=UPI001004E769|nr:hypothetical protein [Dyella sp. M7H15-1]QAU23281.1 hypothetical protein EO087_04180 [Dyella sp. M7H15-1]